MSSPASRLAQVLNLSYVGSNEEDLALSIVALLTSAAAPDSKPGTTLSTIAHEISQSGAAFLLDPLNTLPILLPCKDPAAKDILFLMGECSSAKEVVISAQEAVEVLDKALEGGDEDDDNRRLSFPIQLTILVDLYSSCIPRLKLRRKTATETIKPLLSELESTIRLLGARSSTKEGRNMISSVSHLVTKVVTWSKLASDENALDFSACKEILRSLLNTTLVACEPCIKAFLAQRSLPAVMPRLRNSAAPPGWQGGHESVSRATDAYLSLGLSTAVVHSAPSTAAMIVFAHMRSKTTQLSKLVPILVSSIQTGLALDEALSILLYALNPLPFPGPYLEEDVFYPLFYALSPLSSSHPDPLVRHQAYRNLSALLHACPPPIRLRSLVELANDPEFLQMRVAAVGLIKEAVLEALERPPSIFASPTFLDVFGPILFKPNPADLFSDENLSIDSFSESLESSRLVASLGTYCNILLRDKTNITRIASPDALNWIQTNLLTHLDRALDRWLHELQPGEGHIHLMTLASLKTALQRVDEALAVVRRASEHE